MENLNSAFNPEERLLASGMVSQIIKSRDHTSYTMTEKGVMAMVGALANILRHGKRTEEDQGQGTQPEKALLSRKEVITRLHVTPATLWAWEKRKYLLPIRIGRKVFYKVADIANLEQGRT